MGAQGGGGALGLERSPLAEWSKSDGTTDLQDGPLEPISPKCSVNLKACNVNQTLAAKLPQICLYH